MSDTLEKTPLWLARERTGLSRETVARRLDPPISSKTLERMEKGHAPLRGFRLKQLAAIYEVPQRDLEAAA